MKIGLSKSPVRITLIEREALISAGLKSGSFVQAERAESVTQYTNLFTPEPLPSWSAGLFSASPSSPPSRTPSAT